MQTEVACPICDKRYTVGPDMAGKMVRCRRCANTFTVGATEQEPAPLEMEQMEQEDTAPVPSPSMRPMHAADEFENALHHEKPLFRPNTKFKFPWAAELDTWLPIALIGIGFIWIIRDTFKSEIGPTWASLIRIAVVFGLYAAVVIPITMVGIRKIAIKLKYALPPAAGWRAAAAFALPATLGYVVWVSLGSTASFVMGTLLGLIFGAGAFWMLFRLDYQKELPQSFGVAAGAYAGSLVACGIIMCVLNLVVNGSLQKAHQASALRISPIGPTFSWNAEDAPANEPRYKNSDDSTPAPDVTQSKPSAPSPTTAPAADPALFADAGGNPQLAKVNQTPVHEEKPAVTSQDVTSSSPPDHPLSSSKLFDIPPDDGAPGRPANPDAILPPREPKFVVDLKARQLPFIKSVRYPTDSTPFDQLLFPATSSDIFAVLTHKDATQDTIELRKAATFEPAGTLLLPREASMAARRLVLSPDGKYVVRTSDFPKPGFQLWSVEQQSMTRRIDLLDGSSQPELIGFSDNEHFMAHCTLKNNMRVLQVRDIKSGQVTRNAQLPTLYSRAAANGEISGDGKFYAMTATSIATARGKGGGASLVLYDLNQIKPPRTFPINGIEEKNIAEPAGIAFSRDGSRVSVMFAREGEAYLATWTVKEGRQVSEQVAPCAPGARGMLGPGRSFDWLGDTAWLINGSSVIDAASGKTLATLADVPVKNQWVARGDICQLQYVEKNHGQLAAIELDTSALVPAAAPAAH